MTLEVNRGAAGVDGVTFDQLRPRLREEWPRIREGLAAGTYRRTPVRRVEIPKPGGGVRLLGVPTVVESSDPAGAAQVLVPVFDPHFSEHPLGSGRAAPLSRRSRRRRPRHPQHRHG
ncbi:MAG: hypothetical protein M3O70_28845 [Actinomycetota bacterium]|nr:hypothetical protein [Actinomycetota bacterium]